MKRYILHIVIILMALSHINTYSQSFSIYSVYKYGATLSNEQYKKIHKAEWHKQEAKRNHEKIIELERLIKIEQQKSNADNNKKIQSHKNKISLLKEENFEHIKQSNALFYAVYKEKIDVLWEKYESNDEALVITKAMENNGIELFKKAEDTRNTIEKLDDIDSRNKKNEQACNYEEKGLDMISSALEGYYNFELELKKQKEQDSINGVHKKQKEDKSGISQNNIPDEITPEIGTINPVKMEVDNNNNVYYEATTENNTLQEEELIIVSRDAPIVYKDDTEVLDLILKNYDLDNLDEDFVISKKELSIINEKRKENARLKMEETKQSETASLNILDAGEINMTQIDSMQNTDQIHEQEIKNIEKINQQPEESILKAKILDNKVLNPNIEVIADFENQSEETNKQILKTTDSNKEARTENNEEILEQPEINEAESNKESTDNQVNTKSKSVKKSKSNVDIIPDLKTGIPVQTPEIIKTTPVEATIVGISGTDMRPISNSAQSVEKKKETSSIVEEVHNDTVTYDVEHSQYISTTEDNVEANLIEKKSEIPGSQSDTTINYDEKLLSENTSDNFESTNNDVSSEVITDIPVQDKKMKKAKKKKAAKAERRKNSISGGIEELNNSNYISVIQNDIPADNSIKYTEPKTSEIIKQNDIENNGEVDDISGDESINSLNSEDITTFNNTVNGNNEEVNTLNNNEYGSDNSINTSGNINITTDNIDFKKDNRIRFRVQIAASRDPMDEVELKRKYNGDRQISMFQEEGWYKYTIGEFTDYSEAKREMKKSNVSDVFIAAYRQQKKLVLYEAIRESRR